MESSKLSPRSSTGEKCLGHEGTLNLLETWKEILEERQLRDDDEISSNTITVSVGPQFEGDISKSENIRFIVKLYFFLL